MSAIKRSAISKNLMSDQSCDENFNLKRLKIVKTCCNVFDLVKMKSKCV